MPALRFETTLTDRTALVTLAGELDLSGAWILEQELGRLSDEESPEEVVLDLRGLEFMDSSGLRLVVMADSQAREAGRRLLLVPGAQPVQRVFEITRMNERLTFVDEPFGTGGNHDGSEGGVRP
jgi:anti-sigma B factor antagonist